MISGYPTVVVYTDVMIAATVKKEQTYSLCVDEYKDIITIAKFFEFCNSSFHFQLDI